MLLREKKEPNSDIELRYFYSAGLGNFSVVVNENYPSFYAVALKTDNSVRPVNGINERLVLIDELKKSVAHSKNTNYLINSLVTKQSKDNGGYLGIMVDEDGNLLESPISNIAFVIKDKNGNLVFNVPPFDKTLVGTTVVRLFEYIKSDLIPNKIIKEVNRDYVNIKQIKANGSEDKVITEMMLVGGDFVIPILNIDDVQICSEPGEITRLFQAFLSNDKAGNNISSSDIDTELNLDINI